jgi:hypothetical protein
VWDDRCVGLRRNRQGHEHEEAASNADESHAIGHALPETVATIEVVLNDGCAALADCHTIMQRNAPFARSG